MFRRQYHHHHFWLQPNYQNLSYSQDFLIDHLCRQWFWLRRLSRLHQPSQSLLIQAVMQQ
jgi:hypothetical protein